jgi:hypothetical protein
MTAPAETANQYRAEQIAAATAAAAAAYQAASLAGYSLSNFTAWSRLIRLLFDVVSRQRVNSAFSARQFFDSERLRVTGLPRLDVPLVGYDIQRFEKAMRPAYQMVVKQLAVARELEKQGLPVPKPNIASTVSVLVSREVSAAGREQVRSAVKTDNELIAQAIKDTAELREKRLRGERTATFDPATLDELKQLLNGDKGETTTSWGGAQVPKGESKIRYTDLDASEREVVGWARVATGQESCAWCLMLVSRGPTYLFSDTAGLDLTDTEAVQLFESGGSMKEHMDEWHPGCDCEVVPVFDRNDWPGKQAAADALKVWNKARNAVAYDPKKKYRERVVADDGKITYRMVELKAGEARSREAQMNLRALLAGKDPNLRYIDNSADAEIADLLKAVDAAGAKLRKKLAAK